MFNFTKQIINNITKLFEQSNIHYGHGTENAYDEACFLVYHVLNKPFDEDISDYPISKDQENKILSIAKQRIETKKPLSYLINSAYLAGFEFYVDERVLVPRSPIAELIEDQFMPWINPDRVHRILDLCTGSGSLAIICAKYFSKAKTDAIDIDADALEVAKINIKKHQVENLRLHIQQHRV